MDAFSNVAQVIPISRRIKYPKVSKKQPIRSLYSNNSGRARPVYVQHLEGCGSLAYGVAQKSVCLAAYACYCTPYVHCET